METIRESISSFKYCCLKGPTNKATLEQKLEGEQGAMGKSCTQAEEQWGQRGPEVEVAVALQTKLMVTAHRCSASLHD